MTNNGKEDSIKKEQCSFFEVISESFNQEEAVKTAIITDSNSGMTAADGERWGITILPMPFFIDGKSYLEGQNLSSEEFFRLQEKGAKITTSQPVVGDLIDVWERALNEADDLVYIPMSAGLSGSYETAKLLAKEYGGRVQVVNNYRISATQKASALRAAELRDDGWDAAAIREQLEKEAGDATIYLAVNDLTYLKKGGRITPAVAAIGSVLNIKPVLKIPEGRIDMFAKTRGMKKAHQVMVEALKKELEDRFAGKEMEVHTAYTGTAEQGEEWRRYIQDIFPGNVVTANILPLSIAAHTGSGAVGVGCVTKARNPEYSLIS